MEVFAKTQNPKEGSSMNPVVVTDVGEGHVAFNDPYPPKSGKDILMHREEFQKMLDDIGSRSGMSQSAIFIKNCKPVKEPT